MLLDVADIAWDLITPENVGQAIGALASIFAVSISFVHIVRHCIHNRTKLCKPTVRLLLIVPIYALDCWACLMLEVSVYGYAELLTSFREVYESVAIVSFLELVLTILGGTERLCEALLEGCANLEDVPMVEHIWPLRRILSPYRQGAEFLKAVLYGIFQYVFVSLVLLFLHFVLWLFLGSGLLDHEAGRYLRMACSFAKAASCAWALNCLLLFAHQVHKHVPPCGLFLKFLSIKGIVFFTFWQGFVLWLCYKTGRLDKFETFIVNRTNLKPTWWDATDLRSGLNDLLLCIEVLGFSILHIFAYPAKEGASLPPAVQSRIGYGQDAKMPRLLSAMNLANMLKLMKEGNSLKDRRPAKPLSPLERSRSALARVDALLYHPSQASESERPLLHAPQASA